MRYTIAQNPKTTHMPLRLNNITKHLKKLHLMNHKPFLNAPRTASIKFRSSDLRRSCALERRAALRFLYGAIKPKRTRHSGLLAWRLIRLYRSAPITTASLLQRIWCLSYSYASSNRPIWMQPIYPAGLATMVRQNLNVWLLHCLVREALSPFGLSSRLLLCARVTSAGFSALCLRWLSDCDCVGHFHAD